jgi:non-specific protein-tyrosine kinase
VLLGFPRLLARRKWIVLQAVMVVLAAAVFLSLRAEPRYQATASVLVPAEWRLTSEASPSSPRDRIAQTEADLARVPAVASRALKRVRGSDLTKKEFLERSSVATRDNSDLIDFRVADPSPERAKALATEYARQFTVYRRQLEVTTLLRARRQLERRVDEVRSWGDGTATSSLASRIRDLTVREALAGSAAILVRPATNAEQVQPRPLRALVIGLLIGIALGVAAALLWDALDKRVRQVEEVGKHLGLPLLGRVRPPPRRVRKKGELVTRTEPHGPEAEAIRILRANLEFANVDEAAEVVMVTGAVDGDGTSTTVANLAVAFAHAGRDVVLADLNLRHPLLERMFRLEGRPGLTDVALGHVELDDALVPVSIRDPADHSLDNRIEQAGLLEVLPSGPVPLDSGEFVGSRAVAEVIQKLRYRSDLVLVDAPPLLPVGDARIMSGLVDALVLVTNLDLIRLPMLRELRRVVEACPTRVLGFVVTGVDEGNDDLYGGYYQRRLIRRRRRAKEVAA